jgi:Protein of unknown function (DUF1524)
MRGKLGRFVVVSLLLLVGLGLAAPTSTASAAPTDVTTLTSLLSVAPEADSASYGRDYFVHWIDANGNGCDTREEVLIAESKVKATVGAGCKILSGRWYSPYDNLTFTNPGSLDIDHFVPLHEAWQSGASHWTAAQRQDFANDLGWAGALIAVSAASNRSKSDQDPATWIPTYKPFDCAYVENWVLDKYRWSLSIDPAEKAALDADLSKCPPVTLTLPAVVAGIPSPSGVTPNVKVTGSPSAKPSVSATASLTATPTAIPTASVKLPAFVTAGAFCAAEFKGLNAKSETGVLYTCKASATDARLRWRR